MPVQTLYEVHTLKSGKWMVDSTYPDRDQAVHVAKSLYGEKQFEAVKVIKDSFDAATGEEGGSRGVRHDLEDHPNKPPPPPPPASEKPVAAAVPSRQPKPVRPSKGSTAKSDYAMAIKVTLLLLLILAGGFGILYLLHYATWSFKSFSGPASRMLVWRAPATPPSRMAV